MTLSASEFMRRFLARVLPDRFHRIRHVGFLANTQRAKLIARTRALLVDRMAPSQPAPETAVPIAEAAPLPAPCPCCGGKMILSQIIERASWLRPRRTSTPTLTIDSS